METYARTLAQPAASPQLLYTHPPGTDLYYRSEFGDRVLLCRQLPTVHRRPVPYRPKA